MVTLQIRVDAVGPIFRGMATQAVERGLENGVKQLVELGEERLAMMLRTRPAGVYLSVAEAGKGRASTGNYARNVHGVVSHLHGLITDSGVVYGPWLEGVSGRNATTRFKGYASFRRVGQSLQKDAPDVLERHVSKLVGELNG